MFEQAPDKINALFLPGKMCDKRVWATQMAALKDLVNPIFVDLTQQDTLEDMLEMVKISSDGPCILIGFSMGGYIAQEFVLRYPDRVVGLILIGTSAQGYTPAEKEFQEKLVNLAKAQAFNGLSDLSLRNLLHPNHFNDFNLVNLLKEMANGIGKEGFIRQLRATLDRQPRLKDLQKVTCPALVVAAEEDHIVPKIQMEFLADALPDSEFKSIKECGHIVPLEQPDLLTKYMREWLSAKF